jgi:4-hydroxy-2-oxoheptanedioate aldolase
MPTNPVLDKLQAGEPAIGGWISFASSYIAEMMGHAGYDWVGLDHEHGVINRESLQSMIQALHSTPAVPIVRLPEASELAIKQALDMGARGVIAPMVKDAETAALVVGASRYPPDGFRSVGAGRWRFVFDGTHPPTVNPQILAAVMIEHVESVNNIDKILAVEGLDSIFIGPTDLGASLGYKSDEVADAIRQTLEACRKARVPAGIHVMTADLANERIGQGFQFIAVCEAARLAAEAAARSLEQIRR